MKIFKEVLLCFIIAFLTFIEFIIIGNFYDANNNPLLLSLIIWTISVTFAYLVFIFIPFFNKKKVKYLDGFAFASGFFGIMLYCLSTAKSFDEYTYLSAISYISGFISIIEIVVLSYRKTQEVFLEKEIDKIYIDKICDLSVEYQQSIVKLLKFFDINERFKLSDAAILLSFNENKTKKILKEAKKCGIINEEGNTNAKRYYILKI